MTGPACTTENFWGQSIVKWQQQQTKISIHKNGYNSVYLWDKLSFCVVIVESPPYHTLWVLHIAQGFSLKPSHGLLDSTPFTC